MPLDVFVFVFVLRSLESLGSIFYFSNIKIVSYNIMKCDIIRRVKDRLCSENK